MVKKILLSQAFIAGVLLMAAFGTWFVLALQESSRLRPTNDLRTLKDYLQRYPNPLRVWQFSMNGTNYYEVWGQLGKIGLASGPPAYVFDDRGNLVDWSVDRGDDSLYMRRWSHFTNAHKISYEAIQPALENAK
jgi:hypothetical protein